MMIVIVLVAFFVLTCAIIAHIIIEAAEEMERKKVYQFRVRETEIEQEEFIRKIWEDMDPLSENLI